MKDTFYFPHDYNARHDLRIQALIEDCGASGYGIFWSIVELLHEEEGHCLSYEDFTFKAVAKQMSTTVEQVIQVVDTCIKYQLFKMEDKCFHSERVMKNVGKRQEISEKRSKAGLESARRRKENATLPQQMSTPVQQNPTKKERKKEREEIKESKENEFHDLVFSFDYPKEMLGKFYNYWSEKSKSGKMRWEFEKTFEVSKRLVTWANRDKAVQSTLVGKGYSYNEACDLVTKGVHKSLGEFEKRDGLYYLKK